MFFTCLFFYVSNEERAPRAVKDVLETLGGLIYHGEDCLISLTALQNMVRTLILK